MTNEILKNLDIQVTAKNMEITPALKSFADNKLARLQKHAHRIMRIHLTFEVNKLRQIIRALIHLPQTDISATAESENMYKSIDLLVDKLIKQLDEYSEKHNEH